MTFFYLTPLPYHIPFSGSIPEEKPILPVHSEVATDSAAEHSYDEDDAHILSPLLDEASPARIQITKNNGSRPNSGVRSSSSKGEGSSPLEMRPMMAANNKSKAITIGNGRSNYSNSPSASLLMSAGGDRNGVDSGDDRRRRRHRKMTVGSSDSSSESSNASSDHEGHGDAFDSNIKFS